MIPQQQSQGNRGRLLVAGATLSFASISILGKLAYAAGANEVTILAFRFAAGAAVLWLLLWREGWAARLPGRDIATMAALGILGMGGVTGAFFAGLKLIPASLAIMLMYTYPLFLALVTTLLGRERLSPRQGLALAMALAGVALTLAPAWQRTNLSGVFWVLGAAMLHSLYLFATQRVVQRVPPPVMTAYLTAFAALAYLAAGLLGGELRPDIGLQGWAAILGMAFISTAAGLRLLWAGIRLLGVNRAALITTMEPLVATLLAVLVLGEHWGLRQTLGAALILTGVWWVPGRRPADLPTPVPRARD